LPTTGEAFLKSGVLQISLFDETLAEVTTNEGLRYIRIGIDEVRLD
jgi:hypothetical protein